MKRSRLASTRTLRHDEPLPEGTPRRYRDGRGYIRLRWLVATQTYVEEYEHRIVAGRPHPRFDVHHINGDKSDNRPENLQVLTREEHAALHGATQERRYTPYRSRAAKEKAERAKARRQERAARREQIRDLYEREGLTTVEIAQRLSIHHSTVSRELRAAGGVARTEGGGRGNTGPSRRVKQLVHARSGMRCEVCRIDLRYVPGHIHHRQPRKLGGTSRTAINFASNLLHVCTDCHAAIESNRADAYERGLLVREPTDPAEVYVELAVGRVLLTDDGHYDGAEVWT